MRTLRIAGCFLAVALALIAVLPARGQNAVGQSVIPAGAHGVPGVVIVDPEAQETWSQGRAIARRLLRAGFAVLTVTHDPVAAAAIFRRNPAVRRNDIAVIAYGSAASDVLATIVERYDLAVAQEPTFRSAVAVGPNCGRSYGDWRGSSAATRTTAGAPHGGDVATPGLFRTATPLLIVGGQGSCSGLAQDSYTHEYSVTFSSAAGPDQIQLFVGEYAQYSVISFPSSQPGTTLVGELTVPDGKGAVPAVIISPGTAGIEGFSFWERPWARRLRALGYASLIVDSYMSRHSAWQNHWRIDARTARARDLLDANAYLAKLPFVRKGSIGVIGRSSGGTAILAALVQDAHPPAVPPPFALGARPPFALGVADYGYCQLAYGAWPGGVPTPTAAIAYRTTVPLLIQVGQKDTTVSAASCEALVQSARAAGSPVELNVYPEAVHRFDAGVVDTPPATVRTSVERISSFIEKHVAP